MAYEIVIKKRFTNKLLGVLDYLEKEWGARVTKQFIDRFDYVLDALKENPYIYSIYFESKKIRRCVIHPRIIMYYRISSKTKISILLFWNTSQNPANLKF